jgi:hypothetical protein
MDTVGPEYDVQQQISRRRHSMSDVGTAGDALHRLMTIHAKPAERNCPRGHPLKQFQTLSDRWYCNACEEPQAKDAQMWGCRQCDYDECKGCHQAQDALDTVSPTWDSHKQIDAWSSDSVRARTKHRKSHSAAAQSKRSKAKASHLPKVVAAQALHTEESRKPVLENVLRMEDVSHDPGERRSISTEFQITSERLSYQSTTYTSRTPESIEDRIEEIDDVVLCMSSEFFPTVDEAL